MIFKECGLWKRSNFFLYALAAISFEKFERNLKDDWKKLYFKVVEISAALFQVHLEHYLTISSKFDVSATVGNLSLASWWRNKNRVNRVAGNMAAWYWAEKVVKMLVQQVTREEKDTPLHCGLFNCDRSCFRLPRIGVKPLELEKVRKIGKSAQNWQKQQ